MRLSKDLLSKAIVTIDDGTIVGYVKDIYLTADLSEMAGVHIKKEGLLFRRRSLLVPTNRVVVFGIDVVLVDSADAVTDNKTMPEADQWVLLNKLQGREVDTPGGTRVGTIGDVVLNEEGIITGYALSRVMVEGPIAESRVIERAAVIDFGNQDGIMTIDIGKAEHSTPTPATDAVDKPVDTPPSTQSTTKAQELAELEAILDADTGQDSAEASDLLDDLLTEQNEDSI